MPVLSHAPGPRIRHAQGSARRPRTIPAAGGALRALAGLVALVAALHAPPSAAADAGAQPLHRALGYLDARQLRAPLRQLVDGRPEVDFPGNWPQHFSLQGRPAFRVREVSPFMVAFIHHALTLVHERHASALDLTGHDLQVARDLRQRAVGFMRRFESPAGTADAHTFAFWPYDADPDFPRRGLTLALTAWLEGPILGGQRVPVNLAVFPSTLAIPSDADVTATTYAALLDDALFDDALFDGGPGSDVAFERFFVDWRDLGVVPRRLNPPWLPPASGAFLTWLTYRDRPQPRFPNDVDLVVNANVLYALARHGRLDVPGSAAAVGYLNEVVALGLHRDRITEITDYYPDNLAFQYAVSRAFREGPVPALAPAVATLAADLEASALTAPDGSAYWDQGAPALNTAFAVLTLLNAGRDSALVDRAIDFLASQQHPSGGFDASVFFVGRNDGGQVFEFSAESFTTAMALQAFARHRLARAAPRR